MLTSEDGPEMALHYYPVEMYDCRAVIDATGTHVAWIHGTDCSITKSLWKSMDKDFNVAEDVLGTEIAVPQCERRLQGGAFQTILLPPKEI